MTVETQEQPQTKTAPQGGLPAIIGATGAILVVGLGLIFVFVIALVSLGTVSDDQKANIVASAFTVIGTVVGTYFGVRAGSAGKERVEAARDLESLKVQELAAQVDPTTARAAMEEAEKRAEAVRRASSTSFPAL
jgi:hypothetical protein